MKKHRLTALLLIAAMLVCLAALCACGHESEAKNADKYGAAVEFTGEAHEARVMFVNVGKADCAIVEIDGLAWLVDVGTEQSFIATYSALEALGISELQGIILSHEHDDHIGGLENIIEKYPVAKIWSPDFLMSRIEIDTVLRDLELESVIVRAGDTIPVTEDVAFEVLAPEKQLTEGDDNDNCMVLRLTVNGRTFLFTGDMQYAEEQVLLASGADIKADVLKVGNHGNKDATCEAFANAVSPLIAVISTDLNVDPNSASGAVKSLLSMADIFITQNTQLGVLLTVSRRGEIEVSYPERQSSPEAASALKVTSASKEYQTFTVENGGSESIDLSGWFVYSSKGYETYVFPEGTTIAAGQTLLIACRKSEKAEEADLIWHKKKVWAETKQDYAVLCDKYGNELSRCISD